MAARKPKPGQSLADLHPSVCQFFDSEKNAPHEVSGIGPGSAKKFWWSCGSGHSYQQAVRKKVAGQGCPVCLKKIASEYRNLATERPSIAARWHPTKNQGKTPQDFLPRSNANVWWRCEVGHEWQARIYSVVDNTCPECWALRRSKKRSEINPAKPGTVGEFFPDLLREVDFDTHEPSVIAALTLGSNQKISWKCSAGHTWRTGINKRVSGQGCPYCSNKKIDTTNSFATKHPELLGEWASDLNTDLDPNTLAPKSGKKAWWRCSRGHEWRTTISSRSIHGTQCPKCNPQSSKTEIRVLTELEWIVEERSAWREKIGGFEADVLFKESQLVIEVDGYPWHDSKESFERDTRKTKIFEATGYIVYRLRDYRLKAVKNCICVSMNELSLFESIKELANRLAQDSRLSGSVRSRATTYIGEPGYVRESRYKEIVSYLPGPPPEKALSAQFPDLAAQWHPSRNAPLEPWNMHTGSGFSVWWRCETGHEWQTSIASRTSQRTGCPYCGGKKTSLDMSLLAKRPDLAAQWHPEKNGDATPAEYRPGSKKDVWWICEKGHEWRTTIVNRAAQNTGCPMCVGRRASAENNLTSAFPDVGAMFNVERNGWPATDFLPKSEKLVWWKCPQGHEWQRPIYRQVKSGARCAECEGRFLRPPVTKNQT